MDKRLVISLSLGEAKEIVSYCQRTGRSPLGILLAGCESKFRQEPRHFKIADLVKIENTNTWEALDHPRLSPHKYKGAQNVFYTAILRQLLDWDETRVSRVLQNYRGTRQTYFSTTRQDVSQAKSIGSGWYACTKLRANQKGNILSEILKRLGGFSYDYRKIISGLAEGESPGIGGFYFESTE